MQEKKIKANVLFLCGCGQAFFTRHFAFMQIYDDQAKTYGCKSRSMCERIFIMNKELLELTDTFMDHPYFAEWRAVIGGDLCHADVNNNLPVPAAFHWLIVWHMSRSFSTRSSRTCGALRQLVCGRQSQLCHDRRRRMRDGNCRRSRT
jgi:hypothetical protein